MSGDTAPPPPVVEDFVGIIQILGDGSVLRGDESVLIPPGPFPDIPSVQWKDVIYDNKHGLKVRVYRPSVATGQRANNKLPVLVYFHGGGYCIGAYDQQPYHSFCQRFAATIDAVVLSVQYRLAPENRLPAAIEDGATLLSWLSRQAALGSSGADPWLAESADFSRTFVSGVSAGANLAHHVVVRAASGQIELGPVRIAGYVLFSAFFGSVERTETESDPPADVLLPVEMTDLAWRMALPANATRDHPLANPFGPDSPDLRPLALPPVLLVAPELDVLRSHVLRYAARLEEMGKVVEVALFNGEKHGFSVLQRGEANEKLIQIMKRFICAPGEVNP